MTQLFVPGTLRSVRVCLSADSLLDIIQAKDPPSWAVLKLFVSVGDDSWASVVHQAEIETVSL